MTEERIPAAELTQFIESLGAALDDVVAAYGRGVQFIGLPVEEWAGPGYAVATLFDPEVLAAPLKPARIYLDYPLAFRGQGSLWRFRHGGNIFFRQTPEAVHNRLWCYDEFCDTFHWGVALEEPAV